MKKPNIIHEETFVLPAKNENEKVIYYTIGVKKDGQCPMSFRSNEYIPLTLDQAKNNAEICSIALNITNKNYRIEAIEEMYEALRDLKNLHESWDRLDHETIIEIINKALKNARYEE